MLYYYKVYAKSDCGYCAQAISELGSHGIDHLLILVDKAPDFYEHIKKEHDHHTVPLVVKCNKTNHEDAEFIGGCDDLISRLRSEGYGDD